jgi:hypothetical protein
LVFIKISKKIGTPRMGYRRAPKFCMGSLLKKVIGFQSRKERKLSEFTMVSQPIKVDFG